MDKEKSPPVIQDEPIVDEIHHREFIIYTHYTESLSPNQLTTNENQNDGFKSSN
jgi:hypothetical protein